jgi:hypothetical protein
MMLARSLTALALATVGGLMLAEPARASTINDLSISTCTGDNCSSERLIGSITSHGPFTIPWAIQVGAIAGECVRLETQLASSDLEVVAVSPSGQVFRDDNGGPGNLSLLKISPAESGWYTVQVSRANGTPAAENFTLRYGRYSAGNPNCSGPTAPTLSAVREGTKR